MSIKLLIPLLILLFSCKDKQPEDNYIPKPLMAEVIAEMELAQAFYKFQPIDQRFDIGFMFKEIYKKHKISSEEFNKSLKGYSQNPNDIDEIYNDVITILSEKQAGQ